MIKTSHPTTSYCIGTVSHWSGPVSPAALLAPTLVPILLAIDGTFSIDYTTTIAITSLFRPIGDLILNLNEFIYGVT